MTPVIRIDDQVMDELKKRAIGLGLVFEPPNATLRGILGLDMDAKALVDKVSGSPVKKQRTIDELLESSGSGLREVFSTLRGRILELGEDILEKVASKKSGSYCDYRKSSTFAELWVQTKNNRLLVYIKMGDREIDDPKQWTFKVKESYGWSKLNSWFELNSLDGIDYAMHLIKQAYEYTP